MSIKGDRAVEKVYGYLSRSREYCENYHRRANENGGFVSPLTTSWARDDVDQMRRMKAPVIDLPYARLVLAAFSGKEILDRLEPTPRPFEDGDAQWAERLAFYSRWDRSNEASRVESLAFKSALNSGLGVYRAVTDINRWIPKTAWKHHTVFDVMWDSNAEDPNFTDRTWASIIRRMTLDEFKTVMPQHYDKVKKTRSQSIVESQSSVGMGMERANRRPRVYRGGGDKGHRKRNYDVELIYFEQKTKVQRILVDYGPYFEVMKDAQFMAKFSEMVDGALRINPEIRWRPFYDDFYTYKLIANGKLLQEGPILENYWTINFITGFRVETKNKIQYHGVTDLNKDLQNILNKFASMFIFKFATSVKNSYFKKPGAFDNDQTAEATMARGGFVEIRDFDMVQEIPTAKFPPVEQGMEIIRAMMYDVSGTDPYSLSQVGSTGSLSRTSSKTVAQVAQAGTALIAEPFDNLAKAREESIRMQFKKLVAYISPDQLSKIIGDRISYSDAQPGAQPEFTIPPKEEWGKVFEYDISIDHVPSTSTERQQIWDGLVQHGGLEFISAQSPDLIPELFPGLPHSRREAWKSAIYRQQIAAQQEAQSAGEQPEEEVAEEEVA